MKNKNLLLFSLLIIPAFGFALTLNDTHQYKEWFLQYKVRVWMMIICFFISFTSISYLIIRNWKK